MEWEGAVSPDGDGSHLHPLTRCKSASHLHTHRIWKYPDFPIPPIPCALARPGWKTTYLDNSSSLVWRWTPRTRIRVYEDIHPLPWLSASGAYLSSPLYPQDPDRPMCPATPSSTPNHLHHALHALHACALRLVTLAIPSDPSFLFRLFCVFPIEAPWHPGLP